MTHDDAAGLDRDPGRWDALPPDMRAELWSAIASLENAPRTDAERRVALREFLDDLDREHGPVPAEALAKAEALWA